MPAFYSLLSGVLVRFLCGIREKGILLEIGSEVISESFCLAIQISLFWDDYN